MQKDARAIVVFLKSVLSWLTQRGPPTNIDVDLLLEVRQVCNDFDKQSDDRYAHVFECRQFIDKRNNYSS